MASARQCDLRSRHPESGSPGIAALVPAISQGVNEDLFHSQGQMVFQQLEGVVSHGSWLILG